MFVQKHNFRSHSKNVALFWSVDSNYSKASTQLNEEFKMTDIYIPTDPDAGLSDSQAAVLLGISVSSLRAFRQGENATPPYKGPRFLKLGGRVIYLRKGRSGIPQQTCHTCSY